MGKRDPASFGSATRLAVRAVVYAIACLVVGFASATVGRIDAWYATLAKPWWTPPGWAFGVAWTLHYAAMGVALALVRDRGDHVGVRRATTLFVVQLIVNAAWSPTFFAAHSIGGALMIAVALWALVGWTIAAFWSVCDVAGALLVPYWLWTTFAVALNAVIWRLN